MSHCESLLSESELLEESPDPEELEELEELEEACGRRLALAFATGRPLSLAFAFTLGLTGGTGRSPCAGIASSSSSVLTTAGGASSIRCAWMTDTSGKMSGVQPT